MSASTTNVVLLLLQNINFPHINSYTRTYHFLSRRTISISFRRGNFDSLQLVDLVSFAVSRYWIFRFWFVAVTFARRWCGYRLTLSAVRRRAASRGANNSNATWGTVDFWLSDEHEKPSSFHCVDLPSYE